DIIKKIERARVKMEQIKPRSTLPRGKKEGGLTVKLFKGHYTSVRQRSAGECPTSSGIRFQVVGEILLCAGLA
ncbi:MAG: hypothetical protein ACREYE_19745, partial [Gammaproteobacteria bacterium]